LTQTTTAVKGVRTAPITVASILSLLIGVGTLILGFVLFGLAAGIAAWTIPPGAWDILNVLFEYITNFGVTFSVVAGFLLISVSILHLFGWYWLWGTRVKGGIVGIIAYTVDVTAVTLGLMLLMVFSLLAVPLVLAILFAFLLVGIIMLIMIANGWKTLK